MRLSKNVKFLVIAAAIGSLAPTSVNGFEEHGLLTLIDFSHEENDRQNGPALSSALDDPSPWSSFNQWMCFDSSQVRINSVKIKLDKAWKPWPQISVTASGQKFDFSPETDREIDTDVVIEKWLNLLTRASRICFYAAFLQYLDTEENEQPESLWVLEDFKTDNGYWHSADVTEEDGDLPESEDLEDR